MSVPLKIAKSLWGVQDATDPDRWDALFARIKSEGFSGIECNTWTWRLDPNKFSSLLETHGLELIAHLQTTGGDQPTPCCVSTRDVNTHVQSLKALVQEALKFKPVMINSHSGHDSWSVEETVTYLKEALKVEKEASVPLLHETHRIRIFWNPYITRDVLRSPGMADVKLNADLSHWVCVCERAFNVDKQVFGGDDWWPEVLALVAEHCWLIHARVGHGEGPQVPDPSAEEYGGEVETHLQWWEQIWDSMRSRGLKECWSEPEFGPSPYMQHLPHTNVPVADQWGVNAYIADKLRERYAQRYSASPIKKRKLINAD